MRHTCTPKTTSSCKARAAAAKKFKHREHALGSFDLPQNILIINLSLSDGVKHHGLKTMNNIRDNTIQNEFGTDQTPPGTSLKLKFLNDVSGTYDMG